jgi:hypothetical protein
VGAVGATGDGTCILFFYLIELEVQFGFIDAREILPYGTTLCAPLVTAPLITEMRTRGAIRQNSRPRRRFLARRK